MESNDTFHILLSSTSIAQHTQTIVLNASFPVCLENSFTTSSMLVWCRVVINSLHSKWSMCWFRLDLSELFLMLLVISNTISINEICTIARLRKTVVNGF